MQDEFSPQLLSEIARCNIASGCLAGAEHPCRTIVGFQRATPESFQLSEPWMGHIESAPILFISSNPSIGFEELFPRPDWNDQALQSFFTERFDSGRHWMRGLYALQADGSYSTEWNRFYAQTRGRAEELLGRPARLGHDLAYTEVVHCKSQAQVGVLEALSTCAGRYLGRVLAISPAPVFVVLGDPGRNAFLAAFPAAQSPSGIAGPLEIAGRQRMVAYLPHTNARGRRTFQSLMPGDLPRLRLWLSQNGASSENV